MGLFRRSVPALEHDSCSRLIRALAERVENLELAKEERLLQVMELVEKVSYRLADRKKKREAEPEQDDIDRIIAIRRGASNAVHER